MPVILPDRRQHCRMADTRQAPREQRTVQCASMLAYQRPSSHPHRLTLLVKKGAELTPLLQAGAQRRQWTTQSELEETEGPR